MTLRPDTPVPGTPDQLSRRRGQRFAAVSLALAVALGAVACSDDPSSSASRNETGRLPSAPNAELATADFCDAARAFSEATTGGPPDPAEMAAFVDEVLAPASEALTAALPNDLVGAGRTLTEAVATIEETGDPSALFAPEAAGAQAAIGDAVHEGCGMAQVTVHAVEYAFHGVPDALEAGPTSFELVNDGVEEHEMVLFKRAEGATETLEELLQLPEEEGMAKMEMTGVAFGGPGSTSYAAVDLEPGTYFLICFIPVGGGEEGPPHFMEGMQQTITVT